MQSLKLTSQAFYVVLFFSFVSLSLKAQSPFHEGTLIYEGDTIKRVEAIPAAYVVSKLVVYKKADLLRIEVWRVNKFNETDFQKDIQIRNEKGIYSYVEFADSMRSAVANFAMFMSYDGEKLHQAERIMQGHTGKIEIDKVVENLRWLGLPAEKVILKGGVKDELAEMVITNAIDIPIGTIFDSLGIISGTPLQFVIDERGWRTRLTAVSLKSEIVPNTFFQIDPGRKIMSFEEMLQEIKRL